MKTKSLDYEMNEIQQERFDAIPSMGGMELEGLRMTVNDSMMDVDLKHHFMVAINARAKIVDVASAKIENEEPLYVD